MEKEKKKTNKLSLQKLPLSSAGSCCFQEEPTATQQGWGQHPRASQLLVPSLSPELATTAEVPGWSCCSPPFPTAGGLVFSHKHWLHTKQSSSKHCNIFRVSQKPPLLKPAPEWTVSRLAVPWGWMFLVSAPHLPSSSSPSAAAQRGHRSHQGAAGGVSPANPAQPWWQHPRNLRSFNFQPFLPPSAVC